MRVTGVTCRESQGLQGLLKYPRVTWWAIIGSFTDRGSGRSYRSYAQGLWELLTRNLRVTGVMVKITPVTPAGNPYNPRKARA